MTHSENDKPATPPPAAGVVSSIERQIKNPNRLSVYIENRFAFGIHQDVLLEHAIHSGLLLEEAAIEEIIKADQLIRAKEAALSFLAYRARTEHEIRVQLQKKHFSEEIINQVVQRLYELSYLDDNEFTKSYILNRVRIKGYGPLRIKSDLIRLGIPIEKIENALNDHINEDTLLTNALEHAKKRERRLVRETDMLKKRRKIYQFLLRKGYSSEIAHEVIKLLDL